MRASLVYEAAPIAGRLNEDTCGMHSDGEQLALFVADGAGQRLPTTCTKTLFERFGDGTTAARFASRTVREQFEAGGPYSHPRDLLLNANRAIREQLNQVYGELTPATLRQHEPQLAPYLDEDPRLFRLALPVCVATAVHLDLRSRKLTYAHAGDTVLFLFYADGRVTEPTGDQMGNHDTAAFELARRLQAERGAAHLSEVLTDPQVADLNRRNGLYHNYVDENGQMDPQKGVGVLNGLPQLEVYMQQGTLDLEGVRGVLVCSDGFPWPAPLDESTEAQVLRYQAMRDRIDSDGLRGYFEALRAVQQADSTRDRYPRFKIHDDCTGIYIEL